MVYGNLVAEMSSNFIYLHCDASEVLVHEQDDNKRPCYGILTQFNQ